MSKKPNILVITTDQQRGDCIGAEGRGVHTPNLDRIGANGVRFSNCITPHPMCQAARASILTGLLPYSHGVRDNGRNLDPKLGESGFAGTFAQAGYDTQFIGKAHFMSHQTFQPTGSPECFYSSRDFGDDWTGAYMGFEKVQLMLRPHHHTKWYDAPRALHYEYWLDKDGKGRQRWDLAKEHRSPPTEHFQAWRSALPDDWHSSPWIGDRAVEMIEDQGDQPFMAWVSFPDPHPPFLAAAPWSEMYDNAPITVAKHPELDLDQRPWWHRRFVEDRAKPTKQGEEHNAAGVDWGQKGALTPQALRDLTAMYFGMITSVDHQVGRILAALERAGTLDNTLIIFMSDHGEWLGDHGLLLKGPMLYDGLLRVPCLVQGPGVPQGKVIADPVSSLDAFATAADHAGIEIAQTHGQSWAPLWSEGATRDFALSEYEVDAARSAVDMDLRTVRTHRYRMSIDLMTDTGELYDMQEDPEEMHNLFDDVGKRRIKAELLAMVQSRPQDQIAVAPRVGWH